LPLPTDRDSFEQDGPSRALGGRPSGERHQITVYWGPVDDGIAPLVEGDPFGKQLGTVPVGITGHRVHPEPDRDSGLCAHGDRRPVAGDSGKVNTVGWSYPGQGRPSAWAMASATKTSSALRTTRTTPSG
jgi:hypothetical protein